MSWWSLGEGIGYQGENLAVHLIQCVFCDEIGNFELEHHAEKRKANSEKRINFDTLKCGSCGGYVLVVWSAGEDFVSRGLHDFKVLPYPLKWQSSKNWPQSSKRFWLQAHNSLDNEDYDAALVMARSALQAIMRNLGAKGKDLFAEIEDLAEKGVIPTIIKDWSHEVRLAAKPSAHPDGNEEEEPASATDAKVIVKFMDYLLEYAYDLPAQINEFRANKSDRKSDKQDGES